MCLGYADEGKCAQKPLCEWLNDRCTRVGVPWLMHQSYPLEAAMITVMTSITNMNFWSLLAMKEVYDIVAQAFHAQVGMPPAPRCGRITIDHRARSPPRTSPARSLLPPTADEAHAAY